MAKNKVAGKMAFYKRTRRDYPGIQDDKLRAMWAEKKAKLDAEKK